MLRVERVPGSGRRDYLFGGFPLPFQSFQWIAFPPYSRHQSEDIGRHRFERNARKIAREILEKNNNGKQEN